MLFLPSQPEVKKSSTDSSSSPEDAGFVGNLRRELSTVLGALTEDPVKAVQKYPLHIVAIAVVTLLAISLINSALGGGAEAPKAKKAEEKPAAKEAKKEDEPATEDAPAKKRAAKKVADDE